MSINAAKGRTALWLMMLPASLSDRRSENQGLLKCPATRQSMGPNPLRRSGDSAGLGPPTGTRRLPLQPTPDQGALLCNARAASSATR